MRAQAIHSQKNSSELRLIPAKIQRKYPTDSVATTFFTILDSAVLPSVAQQNGGGSGEGDQGKRLPFNSCHKQSITTMTNQVLFEHRGVTLTTSSESTTDGVLVLILDRKDNVFNPELVASLNAALDVVDERDHPKALVITGNGKFFSNGLDLTFLQRNPTEQVNSMIESVWRVLGRILILDCRTVAAINGHAFGAGLFLALACDFRVMRTKRGYLNWPELNLGMRLAKGFAELTKAKVSDPILLREGVLCGKRYTSSDALGRGLIDQECSIEDLIGKAEELAASGFAENLVFIVVLYHLLLFVAIIY